MPSRVTPSADGREAQAAGVGPRRKVRKDDTEQIARRVVLAAILGLCAATARAQTDSSWTQPFEPFKIADNLYFVGTRGLSSYLLTTPEGHVLIDTGVEQTVPMITANITKLGFKPADIKIMLSSHAHFDHVGGHADMQRLTGATVWPWERMRRRWRRASTRRHLARRAGSR